jgi:hypothetical protein
MGSASLLIPLAVPRIHENPHLINVLKEECYNNDIFSGIHKNSTCANGLQISKDSSEVLKLQFCPRKLLQKAAS